MTDLYLSQEAVVFLCGLVLALSITAYLFSIQQKSSATKWLAATMAGYSVFFGSLVVITSVSFERNTIIHVIQLAAFLLALTSALGFAYHFIDPPKGRTWRWVTGFFFALTGLWIVFLTAITLFEAEVDGQLISLGIAGSILGVTLSTFVVHIRKTAQLSAAASKERLGIVQRIAQPVGRSARAHRAFGLLSLLVLVMAVFLGLSTAGLISNTTVNTIILFGFLAYLFSVVIIYVNHAPEPTSFQVKIVAFALATVVAVLGTTTILIYDHTDFMRSSGVELPRNSIRFEPRPDGSYTVSETNDVLMAASGERIVRDNGDFVPTAVGFAFPFAGAAWDSLYVDDDGLVSFGGGFSLLADFQRSELPMIAPYFTPLHPERGGEVRAAREPGVFTVTWDAVPQTMAAEPVTIQLRLDSTGAFDFRYGHIPPTAMNGERGVYPSGKAGDPDEIEGTDPLPASIAPGAALVQSFGHGLRAFIHERVLAMVWILFGSTLFILVVFPLLLRKSITRPLHSLVEGVRRVNAGDLNTKVNIEVRDELGNLAHNFNQMTASLRNAEEKLRAYAQDLEVRVQERTAELKRSLDELKATQDQLVQQEKLASLGALTAGIAHEIKNPLNFVNNFASLSVELAEELDEEISRLAPQIGEEDADELHAVIDDLKLNAGKITEHGKRADGIVKSMLLHSRGKSGERQETDLNSLLNEYVNLAFHGMRAQDPQFNCDIVREYDESVGEVEIVPQDVGRVFINLLNNAFYAVGEKARSLNGSYAPSVRVSTRRTGDTIEIVVADNGPGIPDSVREKIFEPFFTTKPTGSGTGLGLSLSHDIVTREHGGTMRVESREGEATTFTISLPDRRNGSRTTTP